MTDDDRAQLRHDLRTPLNHIIGYSELLEEEAAQSGLSRMVPDLQKIRQAAHVLLSRVDAVLGGSKDGAIDPASVSAVSEERAAVPHSQSAPAPLSGRVLVVDDDAANREVLSRSLERHGCRVISAEDGAQALELLRTEPTDLVLLDLMMPGLDGESVLGRIKDDKALHHVPVIMMSAHDDISRIARCLHIGAADYLPKPCNSTLLRARVAACLEQKALRDREQEILRALMETQKKLAIELADAADYVESLIPPPLRGAVIADWRFIPSTALGGDAFGYRWLDEDHLAVYLLDVCGHGVGTALLSVSAINVLRSSGLPGTDFRDPGQVLAALNTAFPMEKQDDLYFTMWYGVYRPSTRRLSYASGGHPPAVLVPPGASDPVKLRSDDTVVGGFPGSTYETRSVDVPSGSRLFVFSDGAYEIQRGDGGMWPFDEFVEQIAQPSLGDHRDLDRLVSLARNVHGRPDFDDDFSIIRLAFP